MSITLTPRIPLDDIKMIFETLAVKPTYASLMVYEEARRESKNKVTGYIKVESALFPGTTSLQVADQSVEYKLKQPPVDVLLSVWENDLRDLSSRGSAAWNAQIAQVGWQFHRVRHGDKFFGMEIKLTPYSLTATASPTSASFGELVEFIKARLPEVGAVLRKCQLKKVPFEWDGPQQSVGSYF